MSSSPPFVLPASPSMPPPSPPPRRSSGFLLFTSCLFNFIFLIALGVGLLIILFMSGFSDSSSAPLKERLLSGRASAKDKIAVINISGVIVEGLIGYADKQIEQAAKDGDVKAIVVRIASPGGSITASDHLYSRLKQLRDGNPDKGTTAKPLVVSMGSVAASGGYYIAMPAKTIYAEPTTLTGSIGVYVALPNIHEFTDKHGIKMEVMKRGAVKFAGSPFQALKPEEREMWQDMVDHAYKQFKQVVKEGRPQIKIDLEDKVIDEKRVVTDSEGKNPTQIQYVRQLADGGIYTADLAEKLHLVDKIGYQEDAVKEARDLAGLGSDFQVMEYERPFSLESLLGAKATPPKTTWDPAHLISGLAPRLWYLAPGYDLAGMISAGLND